MQAIEQTATELPMTANNIRYNMTETLPLNAQRSLQSAWQAIQNQQFDRADRLLDMLRLTQPTHPQVWLLSAACYSASGEREKALTALTQTATAALDQPGIRRKVVDAYLQLGAWAEAEALLKQLDPENQRYQLDRCRCSWGLGQYQQTLEFYRLLYLKNPDHPEIVLGYWQCSERLALFEQADQLRQHYQKLKHTNIGITMVELRFLVAEQRYTEATALLDGMNAAVNEPLERAEYLLKEHIATTNTESYQSNKSPQTGLTRAQSQSHAWLFDRPDPCPLFGSSTRLLITALEQLHHEGTETDLILEFGVFHGRSSRIIAHYLQQHFPQQQLHGFDSFAGLPEEWSQHQSAGSYSTNGKLPELPANVTLHHGWFDQTLPLFLEKNSGKAALVHIDCDLYRSTKTVFDQLSSRLHKGSILIFDDLLGYEGYERHEWRAWQEFIDNWAGSYRLIGGIFMGRAVALQLT